MGRIDRNEVAKLRDHGAQLLEVLGKKEYDQGHIPGAVSFPLSTFKPSTIATLNKDRPVIVYCWDYQ